MNEAFSLAHLRPIAQADIDAAADVEADFAGNLRRSVLPPFVALARERGLRVCFIRVLRRPVSGAAAAGITGARPVHRRLARLARGRTDVLSRRPRRSAAALDRVRRRRSHRARVDARGTPNSSSSGWRNTHDDLSQSRLRRVLHCHDGGLLAAAASRAERPVAGRELLFLRLRPSVVPDADLRVDGRRLLGGARDGGPAGAQAPLPRAQPGRESRHAGVLQVLQLLRGERARAAVGAASRRADAGAAGDPAGRHLVLYVPGALVHARGVPRHAQGAARFSRLRDLRLFLSAAGRRPDRAGAASACRRWSSPARFRGRSRARPRCSLSGATSRSWSSPTTSASSPTRCSRSRRRGSTCSGPASSRSGFRSTPTSPPTATSRAARPGGWASTSCATSTIRISPPARGISGGAGTSRCRAGSATTSTFRSADRAAADG